MAEAFAPGLPAWVDLVTRDPAGARSFYGALMGWTFDIGGPETGSYTYCTVDGARAAGMVGRQVETMPTSWTTYFATDDVDATADAMTAAGGTTLLGPADASPSGRVVVGVDPGGAPAGGWQAGDHAGAQTQDVPGAVVWTELVSGDLDGVLPYYTQVFGHQWQESEAGESWPRYLSFQVDGNLAGGATEADAQWPADAQPGWLPYFGVVDVEDAVAAAAGLGGVVLAGPAASPYGRWARLRDPQGAIFQLLELPG